VRGCDPVSQSITAGPRRAIPGAAMLRCPTLLVPAVAVIAGAALLGGALGCLTTLGPDIRRDWPHAGTSQATTRGGCLGCHETETHMRTRMQAMTPSEMTVHMQYITTVVHPPLVQDWMVQESRECVACHAVREPRG
jgi:hypothetical protein